MLKYRVHILSIAARHEQRSRMRETHDACAVLNRKRHGISRCVSLQSFCVHRSRQVKRDNKPNGDDHEDPRPDCHPDRHDRRLDGLGPRQSLHRSECTVRRQGVLRKPADWPVSRSPPHAVVSAQWSIRACRRGAVWVFAFNGSRDDEDAAAHQLGERSGSARSHDGTGIDRAIFRRRP